MAAGANRVATVWREHYVLGESLDGASGAAARVFRGEHAQSGRACVIRFGDADDRAGVDQFLERAARAQAVKHSSLTPIQTFGCEGGTRCFIICDWIEGTPLQRWADELGIPALETVSLLGTKACSGLAALHAAGVAHEALHPRNFIVLPSEPKTRPNALRVMDAAVPGFMRAHVVDAFAAAFMAPEQLTYWVDGDGHAPPPADAAMNVYSMGAVLYALCTGGAPYSGRSLTELAFAQRSGRYVAASKINPAIPPQLDALIANALAIEPSARPTMAQLGKELAALRLSTSASGVRPRIADEIDQDEDTQRFGRVPTRTSAAPPQPSVSQLTMTPAIGALPPVSAPPAARVTSRPPPIPADARKPVLPSLDLPVSAPAPGPRTQPSRRAAIGIALAALGGLLALLLVLRGSPEAKPSAELATPVADAHAPSTGQPSPANPPHTLEEPVAAEEAPLEGPPSAAGAAALEPTAAPSASAARERTASRRAPAHAAPALGRGPQIATREGRDAAPVARLSFTPSTSARDAEVRAEPPAPAEPSFDDGRTEPVVAAPEPATAPGTRAAPEPRPTTPALPLRARSRVQDFAVRGSLVTSSVRRAVERVRGELDACYAQSAQRAQRNGFGALAVVLAIDERGRADHANVAPSALPALQSCVSGVLARVVCDQRPDTGTAQATFQLVFSP